VLLLVAACATAPETGRSQLILFSEAEDQELGLTAFRQVLSEARLVRDPRVVARVRRIGWRIARVTPRTDWDWEFVVIDDDEPNAWALPGGKVGVHRGIFKVARTDGQLAAVIAHEVAHAVARHGVEKVSRELLLGLGLAALGAATGDEDLTAGAAVAGLLLVSLPFSREQEREADHIGLLYMARAGFDPREAIRLWENFRRLEGDDLPAFLSTHPPKEERLLRLRALMPRALEEYRRARIGS